MAEASALIDKVVSFEVKPIIQRRVNKTAGDIAYRKNNLAEAKRLYESAYQLSVQEGREGSPISLGNVYLAIGDITQAEAYFNKAFGRAQRFSIDEILYAKYGLARVALAKGEREKARQMAQEVLRDLSHAVTSHWLLSEIESFLQSLEDVS